MKDGSKNELILGIVGSGGDGVVTTGELLVSASGREGLYVMMVKAFGPQIRGGECTCKVRIGEEKVLYQGDDLDLMVVFNWPDYQKFAGELVPRTRTGILLYEEEDKNGKPEELAKIPGVHWYPVPFTRLCKEATGTDKYKNIVMLGIIAEAWNVLGDAVFEKLSGKFRKKGLEMIEINQKAFNAGRTWAKTMNRTDALHFTWKKGAGKLVMSGNDAAGLGALLAGCDFFAGYPITPSSEVMEWLARKLPQHGGVFVQAEDELAAVNMLVGASFAGRKAFTSTSGPGMCLMLEGIGLASSSEIPCVILNVQRTGPSTGIPTKTEQADLGQALAGTHGDAPKVILAPTDAADSFYCTTEAFYIAEKYQIPVIILSDQFVGQRKESVDRFDSSRIRKAVRRLPTAEELKEYRRYVINPEGISPMAPAGMPGGEHLVCGLEHDDRGWPTSTFTWHQKMSAKRASKLEAIARDCGHVLTYGDPGAKLVVMAWGSSKGVVKEAVTELKAEGLSVSAVIPQLLFPLPLDKVTPFIKDAERILVVEMSESGQFEHYLKGYYNLPVIPEVYAHGGPALFSLAEIKDAIRQAYGKKRPERRRVPAAKAYDQGTGSKLVNQRGVTP